MDWKRLQEVSSPTPSSKVQNRLLWTVPRVCTSKPPGGESVDLLWAAWLLCLVAPTGNLSSVYSELLWFHLMSFASSSRHMPLREAWLHVLDKLLIRAGSFSVVPSEMFPLWVTKPWSLTACPHRAPAPSLPTTVSLPRACSSSSMPFLHWGAPNWTQAPDVVQQLLSAGKNPFP